MHVLGVVWDCSIRVCLMVSKKFTRIANVELMYITFYGN